MGVPDEHRIGFEMHKYYQHFGGEKMHIIALAKESDMWYTEPGGMLIAETRDGSLKETSLAISSCTGWYEISKDIFRENIEYDEYKFGSIDETGGKINHPTIIVPRFFLHVYRNNEIYMFDLLDHYDEDGVQPNILVNDYNNIFKNINSFVDAKEMALIEKLLFERI